ncbi:MAG: hypothetical protein IT164_14540 [Bryobacterales bacterium]|nr:hypothetical protein [Bryobacterales bacterium]
MTARWLACLCLAASLGMAAERRSVFPPGIKPAGPYAPGVSLGGYLYVSGQGPRDANGKFGDTPEANVRQALRNIRAIVEAGGLTMEHVVYAQVYLHRSVPKAAMERVWKETFPKNPPRREVFAAHRMPLEIPVEINAIAVRDMALRKQASRMVLPSQSGKPGCRKASGGVICTAAGVRAGTVEEQTKLTLAGLDELLKIQGYTLADVVATNVRLDNMDEFAKMNAAYGAFFPKEAPPTRTTVAPSAPAPSRQARGALYPALVSVSVLAVR